MAKTKETTALAPVEQEEKALATNLSGLDLEADSQQYVDNYEASDFAIPFLQILQSNSPQVKEGESKFIEDAKAGMIYNTLTKKVYSGKTGILVVVAHYQKAFIEWVLRTEGGGFVKNHGAGPDALKLMASCVKDKDGKYIVPGTSDSHQLVETMQFSVLLLDGDTESPASIAMTSTQLKKGRELNSKIDSLRIDGKNGKFRPPMFYSVFKLTTTLEKKDTHSWYGWVVEQVGSVLEQPNGEVRYLLAKGLRENIERGTIDLDKSTAQAAADSESDAGSGPTIDGERTPF